MSCLFRRWLPLLMTAAALSGSPCVASAPPLRRVEYVELHMGVRVRLVVYAPDATTAARACAAALRRVAAIDAIDSDYRPDSELMRLCPL